MQNPYGNGPVVPENPNAPMIEPEKHSAGIGERLVSGVVQGLKSSVGTALIAGAGGAVLGAAGGYFAGEALQGAADPVLDKVFPGTDEQFTQALQEGIHRAAGYGMVQMPTPELESLANNFGGFVAESNFTPEQANQAVQVAEYARDVSQNLGEYGAAGGAAVGTLAGATTGAAGGAMVGAAKGVLWTDRIKQEREAIALAKATGQIEGGIG